MLRLYSAHVTNTIRFDENIKYIQRRKKHLFITYLVVESGFIKQGSSAASPNTTGPVACHFLNVGSGTGKSPEAQQRKKVSNYSNALFI